MTNARFSHRILAMLLAFLLILTSVPVVAFADEGAGEQIEGTTGTTGSAGSEGEGDDAEQPGEPGNSSELSALIQENSVVVLDRDYVLNETIEILTDVEIDLNGHTVTYTEKGNVGGYYVFKIGDRDEAIAPVVTIRDTSAEKTGAVVALQTGVISLVRGELNIESGYYKAASEELPVLRLDAEVDTDKLTVYDGRFDGMLPRTYDGHLVVYGGMFDTPTVANLVTYEGSPFKVAASREIDGIGYYVVSVGVTTEAMEEICEWYLTNGEDCQLCTDNDLRPLYDVVIHNVQEYVWFARLVAEGAFEYNGMTIDATDDNVILAEDITFEADDLYVPIGSKRVPFTGMVEGWRDHEEGGVAVSVTVPAINAIHAGLFGYLADGAYVIGVDAKVGEVKNVANIMGENSVVKLDTSAGAMVGTVEGAANFIYSGAVSANVPFAGVVAGEANFRGPIHQMDDEGNDVAPVDGYIDTEGLYTAKTETGTVAIEGGFFSFELALEDVAEGFVRTRETIAKDKVNNADDAKWYSVTAIDKFVAVLNNTDVGDYGYFETLQAAIDAADETHLLITVLKDVEDGVTVGADKKVVVNYGRYSQTGALVISGDATIYGASGTLSKVTVKGSAELKAEMTVSEIDVAERATLTVDASAVVEKLTKGGGATIIIKDGFFKSLNQDKMGYVISGGYFTDAAKPLPQMADGANGYAVAGNDDADTQGDYPWTVTNEGNEARVDCADGTIVFEYIEEALDFVFTNKRENAVITLLSDATMESFYLAPAMGAYTIDLGGYTLSSTAEAGAIAITGGDVTIKNGRISAVGNAVWVVTTGRGDRLTLNLADDLTVTSTNGYGLLVEAGEGAVTVNTAANISAENADCAAIAVKNGFNPSNTQVNLTGGTISAAGVGIYLDDVATVNVTGGNIIEADVAVEVVGGTLVMSGNAVVSGDTTGVYVHYVDDTHAPIDVTINGGYYDASENAVKVVGSSETVKMAVNGGVFHAPVVSEGVYAFVSGGYFNALDRNLVVTTKARSDAADYEINGNSYYHIVDVVEAYLYDATSDSVVGYQYFANAIADAAHGATVYVAKDLTRDEAVVMDLAKCVAITSYDPEHTGVKFILTNISFALHTYIDEYPAGHEADDTTTSYNFSNLKFAGDSHIFYYQQQGASALTISGCEADVTMGAFLYARDAMGATADTPALLLTLVLEDSTILAIDERLEYNYAVELQAILTAGSKILRNTFGSADQPYNETFVFKAHKVAGAAQNGGERVVIEVADNTIYMNNGRRPAAAFEFAGESTFLMRGANNKIISFNTVADGELPARIAMYSVGANGTIMDFKNGDNESTIDGNPLTLQNVYYQPGQAPKYVGVRVELGQEDRWDDAAGETKNVTVIVGGIFDFVDVEIQKSLARNRYLLETQFVTGYQGMSDYKGFVVTNILGDGSMAAPYVIPDDVTMRQILLLGAADGCYYYVGEGVDAELVAAFLVDLNDGTDKYTGETDKPASMAYNYYFTENYEGISEDTYVKYGYKSLEEALSDANNRTCVLIAAVDADNLLVNATGAKLVVSTTAVLDLNGYAVALSVPVSIEGGALTLVNTADNDVAVSATNTAFVVAEGSLIVKESVSVTAAEAIKQTGANASTTINGSIEGTVVVENGALVINETADIAGGDEAVVIRPVSADAIINVTVNGGVLSADEYALVVDNAAEATINLTVVGGTFMAPIASDVVGFINDYDVYFYDPNYDADFVPAYGEDRDITYIPDASYFGVDAEGVQLSCSATAELKDGKYYWTVAVAVAQLDTDNDDASKFFSTLYAALNYIYCYSDGEAFTVTLLADTAEEMDIYALDEIVIDLNGKTVTMAGATVYGDLTVENGVLTLTDVNNVYGDLKLEAVTFTADTTVYGALTLKGATTYAGDILVMPYADALDGDAVLNVNDENVTVNGDILVAWNVEYTGDACANATGKATLNISAGTFNGTVRLRNADEVLDADASISARAFKGNITGGYFAFSDETYTPNSILCAQGKAFAIGEVALPEDMILDSGRTTYYEVAVAVAEAEFYTVYDETQTWWVGYADLEEALEALSDTGKVRLVADYTLETLVELNVEDEVIFDLNGKILTMGAEGYISITGAYALGVTNGTVAAGADGWDPMFKVTAGATLATSDVTITSEGRDVVVTDYSYADEIGNVTVKFLEDTVINASADGYASVFNAYVTANVYVDNAQLSGYNVLNLSAGGALYVSGADTHIVAASNAISVDASCKTDWNGVVESIGSFTGYINGGVIECTGEYGYAFNLTCDELSEVSFEIVNTTVVEGEDETVVYPVFLGNFYSDANGIIKGGIFSYVDYTGAYMPPVFENFADGYWPVFYGEFADYKNVYVVENKGVNAIGYVEIYSIVNEGADDEYTLAYVEYVATLADGIAKVSDGKTFYICVDVDESALDTDLLIEDEKDITVDMGGNEVVPSGAISIVAIAGDVTFVNGTLTADIDVRASIRNKASLTLGYDAVVVGDITVYGDLYITDNAMVDGDVALNIADYQRADSYVHMHSEQAIITGTLTVGRKYPGRNAGIPYVDMSAGNINKIELETHDAPNAYVDPLYTYDLEAGENMITGGSIGTDTEDSVLKLLVKEGYLYTAFTTKYLVYADATAEGDGEIVADPQIIFVDLVVGSGMAMKAYLTNVAVNNEYTVTVNGYEEEMLLDEENGLMYVYIPLTALQVGNIFNVVLTDAEDNDVMYGSAHFLNAATELLKGGNADVNNLIYAVLNYARAYISYYGDVSNEWSSDSFTVQTIDEMLKDTVYADGAANAAINGTAAVINGNYIYTITNANGEDVEMTRTALNNLDYRIYGGAGVTPNVVFNDKFDLVLDFRFAKEISDERLAGFTATIKSDEAGAVAQTLAVEKVIKNDGSVALRVVFEGISAMDLDVNYTVVLTAPNGEGTISYTMSVATYMAERMQNDDSETYKDLMKALYVYHLVAAPFGEDDIEIDNQPC